MDMGMLEGIGLTNAEIKVYLALLRLGSSTAGPIIEKSGLQSSVVHMTLAKLVDKGMASFVMEGKRKNYQPANPRTIIEYINEKRERFEELLPQLLLEQESAKKKSEVTSFRGIRGIKELLYELLEAGGKEHCTLSSPRESLMMGEAWLESYHARRAKKGIRAKIIFNESLRSWRAERRYPNSEIRYAKAGFEPLTEVIIRNDKVGMIIWVEKPVGVLIHNATAAKSYEGFFKLLWGSAK